MQIISSMNRPIQGVSQQPQKLRQEGQCTEQINCMPSVVDGLRSRVNSLFIGFLLPDMDITNAFIHSYSRNEETYFLVINENRTAIYDIIGNICYNQSSQNYLKAKSPSSSIKATTVGDTTFISNSEIEVSLNGNIANKDGRFWATIIIKQGIIGQTYSFTINGITAKYNTPSQTDRPEDVDKLNTEYIAKQCLNSFVSGDGGKWDHTQIGNVLFFAPKTRSVHINLEVKGSGNGAFMEGFANTIEDADKLPKFAMNNQLVSYKPLGDYKADPIWLLYNKENTIWNESMPNNIMGDFEQTTMPYVLTRESIINGIANFTLKVGSWYGRAIGDENSCPMPVFIGRTIENIGTFQNRLFFLSEESLCTSRTDSYYDFWDMTASTTMDTDPITVYADDDEVNILRSYATLGGDLIVFTGAGQFLLRGDAPQTPETAVLTQVNSYDNNPRVKPVTTGENLYFPFTYGYDSGVQEMYIADVSATRRAQAITAHVDHYIRGEVTQMTCSTSANTMFVLTDRDKSELYVYDWTNVNQERVQSAWHKWKLPTTTEIVHIKYHREKMYLLSKTDSGNIIEMFDMGDPLPMNLDYHLRMDRMSYITFKYDVKEEAWFSPIPEYLPKDTDMIELILMTSTTESYIGITIKADLHDGNIYTKFPLTEADSCIVAIGEVYECFYEPTQAVVKDKDGRVTSDSKPMLGTVIWNFDFTGNYTIEVEDKYGELLVYENTNRKIQARNNIAGFAPLIEHSDTTPIRRMASDIFFRLKVNSATGFQLRDIEWTGSITTHKKRI